MRAPDEQAEERDQRRRGPADLPVPALLDAVARDRRRCRRDSGWRSGAAGRTAARGRAGWSPAGRRTADRRRRHGAMSPGCQSGIQLPPHHAPADARACAIDRAHGFGQSGRPRSAVSCIARSIGMRTTPAARSIPAVARELGGLGGAQRREIGAADRSAGAARAAAAAAGDMGLPDRARIDRRQQERRQQKKQPPSLRTPAPAMRRGSASERS